MQFFRAYLCFLLLITTWPLFAAAQEESIPFPAEASFKKSSETANPAQTLTALQVSENAQGFDVEIKADGAFEYAYYAQPNPARLFFDFKNIRSQLTSRKIDNPLLGAIRCYELWRSESQQHGSRIVFELKGNVKFEVVAQDSSLMLKVRKSASTDIGSSTNTTANEKSGPPVTPVAQRENVPSPINPVQKKSVVRLPAGTVDLEPADADPALFFTVPGNSTDYVLGAEDVIELKVLQMDELNVTVRIAGDGTITLPFLGSVQVNGLTAGEVSQKVAKLLGEQFLQNPQVSVFVREFNSQKVSVIGAVQTPGTYALNGPRTIIQVLAQAGGVRPDAGKNILVFRQDAKGQSTRLAIQGENLLVAGDPAWNIWLRAGDVVNIPPQIQISVSVFGAVAAPGVYSLAGGSEGTLLKAIARAGGLQRASKSGVKIKRKNASGKETIIEVNLDDILSGKKPDVLLQDGDLIIINESFF